MKILKLGLICVLIVLLKVAKSNSVNDTFKVQKSNFDGQVNNFDLFYSGFEKVYINEISKTVESNQFINSKCKDDLKEFLKGSQNFERWALKFSDAWAKLPAGILWGNVVELGNYDECLSIEHTYSAVENSNTIRGQYCMANLPFGDLFKNASKDFSQIPNIKIGICLPHSCDANIIDNILKQTIFDHFKLTVNSTIVKQEKCIIKKELTFDTIDWIAICLFSLLVFLILLSTIYVETLERRGDNPREVLAAFSLTKNLKFLFRTSSKKSPNVISCLNGIRSLTIVWIIFGHSYMISLLLPNTNSVEIIDWARTPFSMFLQSGAISVDTFFFLSGLLLIWIAMKEMEKTGGKINILQMYLHRYIRLTPVVAAAVLFNVSLYRHMGNGPLWNDFTDSYKLCHKNWWATFLYVQNYAAAGEMCLGHSWYLAVDTQLYVISPLILIPLFRWKKKAVAGTAILGLLLVACIFTTIVFNEFSVFSTTGNLGADTAEMRTIYYATHARTSPWLIGIIFGYFLYKHRNKRIKISKVIVFGGWLIASILLAAGLFALYPKTLAGAKPLTAVEGAFYLTLSRVAWPLALSWIVFACVNGYGGFINILLSWNFWQPMAKLSYCMYIFHLLIETIHGGNIKVNVHFSDSEVILRFWGDFGITILTSIVAYLMFECPVLGIEKSLLKRKEIPINIKKATVSQQDLCDNEA